MIVGLTGYKGSGKDTAADYLVEVHGFRKVAYADPLKDSVSALFDIDRTDIEEWKNDPDIHVTITRTPSFKNIILERRFSFREFLQRYGTEAHREIFGEDFWIKQFRALASSDDKRLVIPDVRFRNEAQLIRESGGHLWRLIRKPPTGDQHISEDLSELLPFVTSTIANTGELIHLYDVLDAMVTNHVDV